MKKQMLIDLLDQKIITDSVPVRCIPGADLKHEVFNPKGSHFLDFDHFIEDMDSNGNAISNAPRGLKTVSKVTHGFRMTSKSALYLPQHLRDSVPTLLDPYPVPIKGRHSDLAGYDVKEIGRVIGGRYVDDYTGTLRFDVRSALQGTADSQHMIDVINEALDSKVLFDPRFEGLGYLLADGLITDPEEILRILDRRALTVSVEMSPTAQVINNITGNDWRSDINDGIDYMPGEMVDGQIAALVYGSLQQQGYAYTSRPADSHAQTIHVQSLDEAQVQSFASKLSTTVVLMDSTTTSGFNTILDSLSVKSSYKGENMKTLLEQYVDSIGETGTEMSQEDLVTMYTEIDDSDVAAAFKVPRSQMYRGLPLSSKLVNDAVLAQIGDLEDEKWNFNAKVELITEIEDSIGKTPEACDNDNNSEDSEESLDVTDSETETVEEEAGEPEMNKENVFAWIADNKEDKDVTSALLESGFTAASNLEVQIQSVKDAQAATKKEKVKASVLKETLGEAYIENAETKAAFSQSLVANRETLATLQGLLSDLTGDEKLSDDATSEELVAANDSMLAKLNMDDIRTKLALPGKAVVDTDSIPDPTQTEEVVDVADADTGSKDDVVVYTADEINIAKRWESKVARKRFAMAAKYITQLKKSHMIADSYNPEAVLASLK